MNNLNFTFLEKDQVFGANKLEIFKKYGVRAAITDFSILLGGFVSSNEYTSEGRTLKYRTGWWWTKSSNGDNNARAVSKVGDISWQYVDRRNGGARPVLPYSSIQSISSNGVSGANGIKEILYGEYPQTIVDENYSRELERAYNNRSLRTTGKNYTTDSVRYQDIVTSFKARIHTEYEYNGSKYIRFVGDSNCYGEVLSDGRTIKANQAYWVRVEPITWLVDERANIALSKKIIFSGVRFSNLVYLGNFCRTEIKQFMDNYFSKEIVTDKIYLQTTSVEQTQSMEGKKPIRKQNPYSFSFDEVSEEDIIRGTIESNIAVFLHGKSSDGKSARVLEIDKDATIIYLANENPDTINGKSVYNEKNNEMIDIKPSWLVKLEEKCKNEPDKLHILFFDEITNAFPRVQGIVFNIILNKEVNGKWKLPDNARIVAAGNEMEDSLSANELSEPLFNRFAHVYIKTTVESWLKWASTPKEDYKKIDYVKDSEHPKIHPAIYAYIAYKSYSGKDVLRTKYTGDKPNADPRKWEMASKVLYKTKRPEMLRSLIGEDLTKDFIAFAKEQVITIEDVINNNYSEKDLEMNISQRFATAVGLSSVDVEHFKVVREFMKKIGQEPKAVFESMWANNNQERLEILSEIELEEKELVK